MLVTTLHIPGLLLLTPRTFTDDRGAFFESFNQAVFDQATGYPVTFVQDNESRSHRNVLRGLHFQLPPKAQGKLVRVIKGAALDVVVDLRQASATFGQHIKVELSAENKQQLWIPAGFAHGFLSLEDDTVFAYKCTDYYSPEHERSIRWNDTTLQIDWGINDPVISAKDADSMDFLTFETPF